MMKTGSSRSPGCFRGYTNEQKTLRAKLDHLLKWTRDLKSNIMKQSCKALQTINNNSANRQIIDQVHDELDDYKRKFDREFGRIHDICDALINNNGTNGNEENIRDEILEALRRSPTYSSLEQHMDDEKRPRIRVKQRETTHPGQKKAPRVSSISTDSLKRKASQPIVLQVLDTSAMSGIKRRSQIDAFKRSRSFTNVEHTETQLGMDYVEEDESDLAWKPFGPKKSISQVSLASTNNEQSNDEQPSTNFLITNAPPSVTSAEKSQPQETADNDSSDEEFDVAYERRMKQKARKEAAAVVAAPVVSSEIAATPAKRTVRFALSAEDPVELIELDLDETTQDQIQKTTDQNNNKKQTEVVSIDDDDDDMPVIDTQSLITMGSNTSLSSLQLGSNSQDDSSQIINDSDDEIIALSDDDTPKKPANSSRRSHWTSSEIQITSGNSQSQSLYNPYRVGIADPSLTSVFLPPPGSQSTSGSTGGNKRSQSGSRKGSSTKRGNNSK